MGFRPQNAQQVELIRELQRLHKEKGFAIEDEDFGEALPSKAEFTLAFGSVSKAVWASGVSRTRPPLGSKRYRNEEMLEHHLINGISMTDIADEVGLSRERVRQIFRRMGATPEMSREAVYRVTFECEACGDTEDMRPSRAEGRRFCSRECAQGNIDRSVYDNEDLRDHLRSLAEDLGHTPGESEINAAEGPSHSTYVNRFGSIRGAQIAAGLEPNGQGGYRHRVDSS